jgi:glycosyltransferase involved in cell wall biosynthesis
MMARLLRRVARDVTPIAVSNAIAEDVQRWLPESAPEVVTNGVDVERFSPGPGDGAMLDALAGMSPASDDTVRVGLVATYARWKGQDVFLRAVKRVMQNPSRQPVRFYIVGGPIYATRGSQFSREELESMSRELGVAERVGLVPFQADLVPVYRALDIVVHASTQPEPFGLTIAEALACGRSVIVSKGGGNVERLEEGVNGIGIAPGDEHGMAGAIRELVEVPARRAGLGDAARTFALSRLDRRRKGPELLSIYRSHARLT